MGHEDPEREAQGSCKARQIDMHRLPLIRSQSCSDQWNQFVEQNTGINSKTMKTISTIILVVLIFLAVSSGLTKILLMQQDVDFFGKYGFSNPILIAYGLVQLLGGTLLVFTRTRFVGAAIVAVTFLISLVVLQMEGNTPVSIVTLFATLLLGVVMKQSWKPPSVS